jgi:hypothetical protein
MLTTRFVTRLDLRQQRLALDAPSLADAHPAIIFSGEWGGDCSASPR